MNLDASTRAMALFFVIVLLVLIGVALFDQESTITSRQALGISVFDFQLMGLEAVNGSGSTIVVTFSIKNTTPVGATLQYATYKLFGDSNYFGRGAITSPVKIPAHGSVEATTDFLLPLAGSADRGSTFLMEETYPGGRKEMQRSLSLYSELFPFSSIARLFRVIVPFLAVTWFPKLSLQISIQA